MPHLSTFSIAAYDPAQNAWGIAVASKFPAVGAVVPWARARAGAVATQAHANTSYGPRGLEMMAGGASAEEVMRSLVREDAEAEHRQVGLVDASGRAATFTGKACYDWAGGLTGEHFAVQGNILAGEGVVQAVANAYRQEQAPFHWRLQRALLAGDRAGGDRRGRQSAAILVVKDQGGYGGYNDRWIDYRVDDHPDPVVRLGELLELHDLYFGSSSDDERIELSGGPLQALQEILLRQGYYQGLAHGEYDPETRNALDAFIGSENFEERTDIAAGRIDRPVYEYLLRKFGAQT